MLCLSMQVRCPSWLFQCCYYETQAKATSLTYCTVVYCCIFSCGTMMATVAQQETPARPSNTYFFPSWACLSLSCKPSTTWWKSNTTAHSRQIDKNHNIFKNMFKAAYEYVYSTHQGGLCLRQSVFFPSLSDLVKWKSHLCQYNRHLNICCTTPHTHTPFFSFLSPSSNNPGRWMTTPFPMME